MTLYQILGLALLSALMFGPLVFWMVRDNGWLWTLATIAQTIAYFGALIFAGMLLAGKLP